MSEFAEFEVRRPEASAPYRDDEVAVRDASDADLDALAEISARREGRTVAEMRSGLSHTLDEAAAGRALLLVAVHGGEAIGYGQAAPLTFSGENGEHPPIGWYLTGLVVDSAHRRRGVGERLTVARLDTLAARTLAAHYFASAENPVTIALHRRLGFVEVARGKPFPGVEFTGGVGILFRCDLASRRVRAPR